MFCENWKSLYEILPKFWNNMSTLNRTDVITIINRFYNAEGHLWRQDRVLVSDNNFYVYCSYCSFTNDERKLFFILVLFHGKRPWWNL